MNYDREIDNAIAWAAVQRVANVNGVSLWYVSQGQGTPIVLVHGGPGMYDYLGPVAEMLDHSCYQVIRYDQRGSWRSEKKGPYDVETFIEDLELLRIHLGFESWIVCGHSWGATLALAYTVKYQSRVRALLYISGTGVNPAWHADYRRNRLAKMNDAEREQYISLRSVVDTADGEEKERIQKRIRELSLKADLFDPNRFQSLPRADGHFINKEVNRSVGLDADKRMENTEFQAAVCSIHVPSLFLHGEADPRPYSYAQELADLVRKSAFRLVPEAGHYPWLENPESTGNAIRAFLTTNVDGLNK